jgi:hypothetical protein
LAATGAKPGTALSHSTAMGISGGAFATAVASGAAGPIISAQASSNAPVASTTRVEAFASVTGGARDASHGAQLQSIAYAAGNPLAGDVAQTLHGNVDAYRNFALPSVDKLGQISLGASYPDDGSGEAQTFSSSAWLTIDVAQLDLMENLRIGLVDPLATGGGFDSLTFSITSESSAILVSETFTLAANALAYFDDHILDLGSVDVQDGMLDLQFDWSLTTNDLGEGFYASLLVGSGTDVAIAGDYNLDGVVDGADLLAIQRNDLAHLPLWEGNFGYQPPPSVGFAIPEPATIPLALFLLLVLSPFRWLRGRRILNGATMVDALRK